LFSAWMLAIQYCDYPFDNHKVPFKTMRTALRTQKVANMQFGAMPGKRIFVASIRGDVQQHVKTLEETTVAATNTQWSKLQATAW
ncbi:hypothetical protein MJL27_26045, partial [Salmonella enterica subsp. enterica serovar Anatum]|nr:hypothetical protein [Salmonella enterica subsp. enterica serovar Anatum]